MGCGSCGTKSADGKPSGCNSNGGCSSGGCNRLNVFNWLSDIPFSDFGAPFPIIEVSFNNGSRKDFFKNQSPHLYEKGQWVAVEGAGGYDVGQVSLTGELVKLQMKKYGVHDSDDMKKLLRPAAERDLEQFTIVKDRERDTMIRARAIAKELNLEMKIAEVEFQADAKKVTFFYTADNRVDFRELIKVFASEFKSKIEMRQIGARQESAKVGGVGSCGRELCCSSWLSDFKTVNTTAARYQNLSINQTKLSGQCGRLKCCLNYELDTYMDALHAFPEGVEQLEVASGRIYLQKKDIFKNLMWYAYSGSNKLYPLSIERVEEIAALNKAGEKPEELEAVEIQVKHKDPEKSGSMGFVNDVGQLTLSSLSKSSKKKQKQKQADNKPAAKQQGKQQTPKQGQQQKSKDSVHEPHGEPNNLDKNRNNKQRQDRQNRPQHQQRQQDKPQATVENTDSKMNVANDKSVRSSSRQPNRVQNEATKHPQQQDNSKPAESTAAASDNGTTDAGAKRPPYKNNRNKKFKNKPGDKPQQGNNAPSTES